MTVRSWVNMIDRYIYNVIVQSQCLVMPLLLSIGDDELQITRDL
jgi:hypothetical protein